MTTKKSNQIPLSKEEQLEYMDEFWEDNLRIIHVSFDETLKKIPNVFAGLPNSAINEFKKCVAIDMALQLKPIVNLIATLRVAGPAKSLIYLNAEGVAIDLLKVIDINQEEAINQILDNTKAIN